MGWTEIEVEDQRKSLQFGLEALHCFWWRRGRVDLGLKHGLTLCIVGHGATREAYPVLSAVA